MMGPFFLFLFIPLIFIGIAAAWEDPFQADLGLNYDRLWMKPTPCSQDPLIEGLPSLQREGVYCPSDPSGFSDFSDFSSAGKQPLPPVSAALNWDYQDLLHKSGSFALDYEDAVSGSEIRLNFIPKLDIRTSVQQVQWDRTVGDSSLRIQEKQTLWQSQNSASYTLGSWVPYLVANWNSAGGWETALALRGAAPLGFSGSIALGAQREVYPVALTLEGYSPISVPFLLQQDFAALSAGWRKKFRGRLLSLDWTGRWRLSCLPTNRNNTYSLSDSGQNLENIVDLAVADSQARGWYRLSLEASLNSGQHVFEGSNNTEATPFNFGYEQTQDKDYSLRLNAEAGKKNWDAGVFAGASVLEWDGLRPEAAFDKYFWDRNSILNSYEGNIFDIFDDETWLFDGNMNFHQWSSGAWLARNFPHWRAECGLAYNAMNFEGLGHLSKKTTTLLIAYTEQDYTYDFQGLQADLLTPELKVSGRWGHFFALASLAQALPLSVQLQGENASSQNVSASSYSGGTRAEAKIGWGFL